MAKKYDDVKRILATQAGYGIESRTRMKSAGAADLPVFSVGATREEAEREIREAIGVYLDDLANQDLPPTDGAVSGTVTV